ncbi:2-phospho-L-lactate transferase CofD family protein [Candidatus Parvarchaeota archaeon]|nr:2-phospho-L-lactate transferase CofD family protein [Candidatus Parvarchaeota archaeon]
MKTVTIIGGSGARNTLKALRKIKNIKINNIVTMFDSGGSTGYLRKKFGIYALGDLRDRILAVSENEALRDISSQRIEMEGINHNVGNLLLYSLVKEYDKDYLKIAKGIFKTPKNIDFIPVVDDIKCSANLVIKTDKGDLIGEDSLDKNSNKELKIKDVKLDKKVRISRSAADSILKSDFLIFGPGDVYSSILPNTLVDGFDDTIAKSRAKKILIVNIMNKKSETNGFKTSDFVRLFESRGIKIDYILINNKVMSVRNIKGKYGNFSDWVENDLLDKRVISGDFINESIPYEHDPEKILMPLKRIIK